MEVVRERRKHSPVAAVKDEDAVEQAHEVEQNDRGSSSEVTAE